jgi:hypothetical protein
VGMTVVRTFMLQKPGKGAGSTPDRLHLEIQVDPVSTDNAQEGVLTDLMQSNFQPVGGPLLIRGAKERPAVGDISFVPPGKVPDRKVALFTFVRNNVRVILKQVDGRIPLDDLASRLDQTIQAVPALTGAQLHAAHVPNAEATADKAAVARGEKTTVTLVASDPQGLPLKIFPKASGGRLDPHPTLPNKFVFRGTESTGEEGVTARIRFVVVNAAGLFREAGTTIFVSPTNP